MQGLNPSRSLTWYDTYLADSATHEAQNHWSRVLHRQSWILTHFIFCRMGLGIFEEAFLQELGGFIAEGIGGDIEEDYARTYVCSEDGLSTHVSSPFVLCVFTPLSRPGDVKYGAHSVIVRQ